MRKLFTICLALAVIAFAPLNAKAAGWLLLVKPGGGGGCSDTNATAWAAAVVTAGGTVSGTQLTNVCNLIVAYKAAGVYALMDEEWLYASENAFTAKVSIVAPYHSHTLVNSPVFTANRGYAGGTGPDYINTGYVTGGRSLNDQSFGAYVFSPNTTVGSNAIMGNHSNGSYSLLEPQVSAGNALVDSTDTSFSSIANTNAQGSYVVSRTSSTNINFTKNANSVLTATAPSVAGPPNLAWFVFTFNDGGGPNQNYYPGDIISSVFFGGTLTSTQVAGKNAALNTYMTTVGANVY
jgi:hypothetical protein